MSDSPIRTSDGKELKTYVCPKCNKKALFRFKDGKTECLRCDYEGFMEEVPDESSPE